MMKLMLQRVGEDAVCVVEGETTLAENNNEYSNKNSLFYSDISSYEIFTDVNSEAAITSSFIAI